MLILGVEPSLIAYKTIVRTDTLYELFTGFIFFSIMFIAVRNLFTVYIVTVFLNRFYNNIIY